MHTHSKRRVGMVVALVAATVAAATVVRAPNVAAGDLRATPLAAAGRTEGFRASSSRLAQSDADLLTTGSTERIGVLVKLDYDAAAAYAGTIDGLAATSPSITGRKFDAGSAAAIAYDRYIAGLEQEFVRRATELVPALSVVQSLRVAYGGVAVTAPAASVKRLLRIDGVVAVQHDDRQTPLTDSSGAFIGAPSLYASAPPGTRRGEGAIVGILDSGAWPEHPSFADNGTLPVPPPKSNGTPRTCNFGDNPLTPATDVFACQNKLIGGAPFLDTYNSVIGGEVYPASARDSNGHGTHTASTAAGAAVASADPLGIDRGAIEGIASRAHVSVYKVCGAQGCYGSDSVAAVGAAIVDGVDVINYSISGGSNPFSDPVELAFLDAFAANVFVAASAGNAGPGAGTVDHRSPWVTTVAASTQRREFRSTLTLEATASSLSLNGASITAGISSPLPVVLASAAPYSNADCTATPPPGLFTGKVVACRRGPGRVLKGFNVSQGGAAGMILYNASNLDTMTDNHWLPTVHLDGAEGAQLLAFLAANPATTATFTQGAPASGPADQMTTFSSRGPGGDWLKPDVTAPGIQILAGQTPTPEDPSGGPPGNLFQAIAGTSMSSPHVAGSGALLRAIHPTWTAGQIKSALMTSATTAVVDDDGSTPADPFDFGSGRIDLTKAGAPGLTVADTAANMAVLGATPATRVDINVPSINSTLMPGALRTTRTFTNVSGRSLSYTATAVMPPKSSIDISPRSFTLPPGGSVTLTFIIHGSSLADGQYLGRVDLTTSGPEDLHLPVAFVRRMPDISVDSTCNRAVMRIGQNVNCTITASNQSLDSAPVKVRSLFDTVELDVRRATIVGPNVVKGNGYVPYGTLELAFSSDVTLAGRQPSTPSVDPGSLFGYVPLDAFGVAFVPIGDEEAINVNVPGFVYGDGSYTRIGVTSNGYVVVGGTSSAADIEFEPQDLPDPAAPNNVLAPYWTDLNGAGAPGVAFAVLTDGVDSWVVVEWRLNLFGTTTRKVFQTWIGINGTQDITFAYDPTNLPGASNANMIVGAENPEGSRGDDLGLNVAPTGDLRVTSTPGAPGASAVYTMTLVGTRSGPTNVRGTLETPALRGRAIDVHELKVNP